MKSDNCRGPIGWFVPSMNALSMSSRDATLPSRSLMLSLRNGINALLTMNPVLSSDCTTVFPSDSTKPRAVLTVDSEVWLPLINSTSFIVGTGLKKSEEHTSELQSQSNLVCRLLLLQQK